MSGATTTGPVRSDRNVLLDFYRVAGGILWRHQEGWEDNANDLGTWYGVTLNGQRRVVTLDMQGGCNKATKRFEGNNVRGVIPSDIGQLDALTTLCLGGNKLTGNIPPEVGQLASLTSLNLSNNCFDGPIPAALSKLVALTSLELASNRLTGPIPSELSNVVSLTRLDLSFNGLETIPSWLGKLVALKWLSLGSNGLSGSIPSGLSKLVALNYLCLSWNELSGSIPFELRKLVALETIDLHGNSLTGAIPTGLRQLVALKMLILGNNNLTGRIPCGLVALETLAIDGIFLVRELGYNISELSKLPSLNRLCVSGLQEAGFLVSELSKLGSLTNLYLGRYQLDGSTSIPSDIGKLVGLRKLGLDGDGWTGSLPSEICQLAALSELRICGPALTGSIPSEMSQVASLTILHLVGNKFSGSIPAELSNLPALEELFLGDNQLTGLIPVEFGKCSALKVLRLEYNLLTGLIPSELGKMSSLTVLDLGNNRLTGSIPSELGEVSSLVRVNLDKNRLTGLVPAELSNLADLVWLDLRFNKLTSLGGVDDAFKLVQKFKGGQRHMHEDGLLLEGNPWIMPPEAVVEEGLLAVETYIQDVRTASNAGVGIKTMQLLKVVLVGSSQAGKTSLMDSIVHGEAKPTEGTPEDVSTIGIQLRRHRLKDVRVEFYDCAGQIDYAGMHQVFLSPRALYLLVWDVKKCQGKAGSTLDKVIEDDILPWLYALHLRAPDSTVILVANKCDGSIDSFSKTVQTVRTRVNVLLSMWHDSRGFPSQDASRLSTLNVLAETSEVSCQDGCGLAELVDVITAQSCTSISVPPSWDLALVVMNALRDKRAPLNAAREHLNLSSSGPLDREDRPSDLYIPKKALTRQWDGVLRALTESGELQSAAERSVVLNPDSALEGSLWISEFAGQLLRVDGGDGIFLDVGLLSEVLNPIVDHKLPARMFKTALLHASKHRLVNSGVLNPAFARHLWANISLEHAPHSSTDQFESALFYVLIKLGVALPLGRERSPEANDGSASVTGGQRDMLVWRWLPEGLGELGETARKALEEKLEDGARDVTLKWEFDSAGAPQGLMERLIALCHGIGEAEEALCWRSGAVFWSPRLSGGTDPLYVAEIRYNSTERVLSVKMLGNLTSSRVWAALRFVASVMVNVSKEWPGALWAGWVKCPYHPLQRLHLATPTEAILGSPLIPLTSVGCACRREGGTVIRQAVARLGNVIDTKTGDPFLLCEDLDDGEQMEEAEEGSWHACCDDAFSMWRPHAWKTAAACLTPAFALFLAVLVEDLSAPRTYAMVASIVVLVAAAGAAACVAFRQDRAEQPQQHHGGEQVAHIA